MSIGENEQLFYQLTSSLHFKDQDLRSASPLAGTLSRKHHWHPSSKWPNVCPKFRYVTSQNFCTAAV